MAAPLVRQVAIRNFKSISACRVALGPLTFLVGPNGSGKSNFLDALRFVANAIDTTLEQAIRDRGGIRSVRRRSRGHPHHFGVSLELNLPDGRSGGYAFEVAAERKGSFVVQRERCWVAPGLDVPRDYFSVAAGSVTEASCPIPSALEKDRLALVALSGLPQFRAVYDALRRMSFYNLNPDRIRDLQDADPGTVLAKDGRNLASVIRELDRGANPEIMQSISEHLQAVVPGVTGVKSTTVGPKETLEFQQEVAGDPNSWGFAASEVSDGTLRALGVLVAAFQALSGGARGPTLVAIEEPEVALHPGAAQVIAQVLRLASAHVQVLATTHSADLLNHKAVRDEELLAVSMEAGETSVGPLDPVSRSALRDRLYAAGELLAQGSAVPDRDLVAANRDQLELFPAVD